MTENFPSPFPNTRTFSLLLPCRREGQVPIYLFFFFRLMLLPTVPRAGVLVRMLLLVPICTAFSELRRHLPGRGANKRDANVQFSLSTSLIRLETVSKIHIIKRYFPGQGHIICQREIRKLTKSDTSDSTTSIWLFASRGLRSCRNSKMTFCILPVCSKEG